MEQVNMIVSKYLDLNNFSLREFAAALNERLTANSSVTHVSVANWRDGKFEPATDFLCLLVMRYRDWRFQFALECLAAKHPDVWGYPNGGIWLAGREIDRNLEFGKVTGDAL